MNNILVVSHERSGTHFLIESILANISNSVFPKIRPSFSTIENLLLPHDQDITEKWSEFVFNDNGDTKIYKTHVTREELLKALNEEGYLNKSEKNILNAILMSSKIVYISRNTEDVMYSLYNFMKNGGALQNASTQRLEAADFSQFIRMPNHHIMPIRAFDWFDYSLPRYHNYHVRSWRDNCDYYINYESLKGSYAEEAYKLMSFLGTNLKKSKINQPPNPFKNKSLNRLKSFFSDSPSYVLARKGIIGEGRGLLSEEDKIFISKEKKIVDRNF